MERPSIGAAVPRRGNVISRFAGRALLGLLGWRFEGGLPDLPRFVLIIAPHTSNWDFVIGIAARMMLGLDVHWLGKHTLFSGPWGVLLRWLRGIPVNRSAPHGMIAKLAGRFKQADRFVLAIAPEGTRGRVSRWKSGFYFIALQAGVPVVPASLDYGRRMIGFHEPLWPSGHLVQDLETLQCSYAAVEARRPDLYVSGPEPGRPIDPDSP